MATLPSYEAVLLYYCTIVSFDLIKCAFVVLHLVLEMRIIFDTTNAHYKCVSHLILQIFECRWVVLYTPDYSVPLVEYVCGNVFILYCSQICPDYTKPFVALIHSVVYILYINSLFPDDQDKITFVSVNVYY